ncbi:MAG: CPBP family intramembrane metalloprotease [Caldilineaceae bacterium]|nr:CPBP family intramembrane metalloprotease [Caldilineaceae bacterium]
MSWVKASIIRPFWNTAERRLRAGWRVALYSVLWVTIQIAATFVMQSPLTAFLITLWPALAPIADAVLFYLLNTLLVIGMTWVMTQQIDHRTFAAIGLRLDRQWLADLGFGLLLGAGLMTLIFAVEWGLGWIRIIASFQTTIAATPFRIAIWQPIFLFLAVGINEEILSRGYHLRNLAEGIHSRYVSPQLAIVIAWLISSLIFGFLHILNPNSTWVSTLALMLAGIFLGLGYVLTGRLGLPIGLHITWNFFQGSVYGFRVSGNNLSDTSFITIQQAGPPLWTGGAFGPEAGLIGIVAILLGMVCTLLWVRWHYGTLALQPALATYRDRRRPLIYQEQGALHVE